MSESRVLHEARSVLREWLKSRGEDTAAASVDGWEGSVGPAACAFVPNGGRANRIYLVRGEQVVDFAPSEMQLSDAIRKLLKPCKDTK